MARYNGHRIPDQYHSDWAVNSLGEWYDWWHLGHEDGVLHTELEIETKEIKRLTQENEALKNLVAANVRVIKEELRKELEDQEASK